MSHLFYHLRNLPPGIYKTDSEEPFRASLPAWRKLGLGPVVDRVHGNGVLHALDNGESRLCVWPEYSEFTPPIGDPHVVPIDDELSISWTSDTPPGPAELDNGNPLRLQCVPLELADGNVWQIPIVRDISDSFLPTDLIRDRKTGELLSPIKREYESLWHETEFFFDLKWKHLQSGRASVADSRAVAFCTELLGLRYRFCDATQAALRVLDSTNVQQIIEAALSWHEVMRVVRILTEQETEKKNLEASASSVNGNSGLEASAPITDPAAENNGPPPLVTIS